MKRGSYPVTSSPQQPWYGPSRFQMVGSVSHDETTFSEHNLRLSPSSSPRSISLPEVTNASILKLERQKSISIGIKRMLVNTDTPDAALTGVNMVSNGIQIVADSVESSPLMATTASVATVPFRFVNLIAQIDIIRKILKELKQAKREIGKAKANVRNATEKVNKKEVKLLSDEVVKQSVMARNIGKRKIKGSQVQGLKPIKYRLRVSALTSEPTETASPISPTPPNQIDRPSTSGAVQRKEEKLKEAQKKLKQAQEQLDFSEKIEKEKAANQFAKVASASLAVGGTLANTVSSIVGGIGFFLESPTLGMASTATGIIGGVFNLGFSAKGLYDDYKNHKALKKRNLLPLTDQPFFKNASPDQQEWQKLFKKCDQLLPSKIKIRFSVASHSIGVGLGLVAVGAGIAGLAGATLGLALPIIFGVGALAGIGFAAIQLTERWEGKNADQALLKEFNEQKELDDNNIKKYLVYRGKDSGTVKYYLTKCKEKLDEAQGLKNAQGPLDKYDIKTNRRQWKAAWRDAQKYMKLARES